MTERNIKEYIAKGSLYLGLLAVAISGCAKPENKPIITNQPSYTPVSDEYVSPTEGAPTPTFVQESDISDVAKKLEDIVEENQSSQDEQTGFVDVSLDPLPNFSVEEILDGYSQQETIELSNEVKEKIFASTVLLTTNTPDGKEYTCSGIHIGDGKILSADHCLGQFKSDEITVKAKNNKGLQYSSINILNVEGIDLTIIQLDNFEGLSSVNIENTAEVSAGDALYLLSLYVDGNSMWESALKGIYAGGSNDAIIGEDADIELREIYPDTLKYGFDFLVGDGTTIEGFSGSGVYNTNGDLVGLFYGGGSGSYRGATFSLAFSLRTEFIKTVLQQDSFN